MAVDRIDGWQKIARAAAMGKVLTEAFGEDTPSRLSEAVSTPRSASATRTWPSSAPSSVTGSSAPHSRSA
ncbi:hypothetical protein NKG05_16595 [Oerskovia sp. M15]